MTAQDPILQDIPQTHAEENLDDVLVSEEIPQPLESEGETTTVSWSSSDDSSIQDEIKRLQEALARSQADYQNLLMRVERDKSEMVHFLSVKIILPLLSQVDNLERAVALKSGIEGDGFVDGIRSVLSGFEKYLESQGVKSFISLGEEVDANRHDVMTQMPGEAGKILQEFEKGYMIGDRVLRHAKVVVGMGE